LNMKQKGENRTTHGDVANLGKERNRRCSHGASHTLKWKGRGVSTWVERERTEKEDFPEVAEKSLPAPCGNGEDVKRASSGWLGKKRTAKSETVRGG